MLRLLSGAPPLAVTGAAVLALGVGVGFALADVARGPVPAGKAAALERRSSVATFDSNTVPVPAPEFEPQPIPGQMLGSDAPVPVAPPLLQARNGWLVSDGKTLVAVYAGAAGGDASMGSVVILRQDLVAGTQTVRTLDTGPTGALTIAAAPLGSSVETSAQTGSIALRTAGGRRLRLDLRTGKVGNG